MKIYSSSAGSGKTFTLVKEYLSICLGVNKEYSKMNVKKTLAITFTNNATREMKMRIINYLEQIALFDNNVPDILEELTDEKEHYGKIRKKAIEVLNYIFANYSDFSIMTIDSFIQRMIRNFSIELNIPLNFELFLEEDDIINLSCLEVLSMYGKDEEISKNIMYMIEHNIRENASWDIEKAIIQSANRIYKMQTDSEFDWEKFNDKYRDIIKKYSILKNEIKGIVNNFLELTEQYNIQREVLNANVWKGIEKIKTTQNIEISKTVKDFCNDPITGIKSNYKESKIYDIEIIVEKSNLQKLPMLIRECAKYHIVIQNIYNVIIFKYIRENIEQYKNKNNIMFLSDSTHKIKNMFDNAKKQGSMIPFIYYKLGNKYENFLIDEFQDTSRIQWQALKPLVEDALSQGGMGIIVGDLKQAIYRWRGGDIDIMSNEIKRYSSKSLNNNYRSDYKIVEFNNEFFSKISENNDINWNFENICQNAQKKDKGYVEISVYDKNENDKYIEDTIKIIEDARKRNYACKDICILIRNNNDINDLIIELSNKDIPYIAKENINLSFSPFVLFIIDILKFFINPNDDNIISLILMSNFINANIDNVFEIKNSVNKTDMFFEQLKRIKGDDFYKEFMELFNNRYKMSIYGIIARIISIFNMNDFFTRILLNESIKYINEGGIVNFIEEWDKKIKNIQIDIPDNIDAVKIMTIHKAKGLQFPIVIIPKAHWDRYFKSGSNNMLKVNIDNVNTYIRIKKAAECFEEYKIEKRKIECDNINLLYVAFTRAQKELYVMCNNNTNTIGPIIYNVIERMEHIEKNNNLYFIGEKKEKNVETDKSTVENCKIIKDMEFPLWQNRIVISKREFVYEDRSIILGKALHLYMERTKDFNIDNDLLSVIEKKFQLSSVELKQLREWIKNIINTEIIKYIVDNDYYLRKEVSIINYKKNILNEHRIDLLAIKDNNAIIIDYKTGEREEAHKKQIKEYMNLISQMKYNVKGYIIYTNSNIEVVN